MIKSWTWPEHPKSRSLWLVPHDVHENKFTVFIPILSSIFGGLLTSERCLLLGLSTQFHSILKIFTWTINCLVRTAVSYQHVHMSIFITIHIYSHNHSCVYDGEASAYCCVPKLHVFGGFDNFLWITNWKLHPSHGERHISFLCSGIYLIC